MPKGRLEAFSDGVIAIVITIMVLELKVPHTEGHPATPAALVPLLPVFGSYVLSFVHVGIYWNNHHHLLHAATTVSGRVLWANLHLLFWLSLVPFVTAWMGENGFAAWPVALYGGVMLGAGGAYYGLDLALVAHHGRDGRIAQAIGAGWKEKGSLVAYVAAVPLAFVRPWIACALYVAVALSWFVPDRRLEAAA